MEKYILENDPECLLEIKQIYDANYRYRNKSAMSKGIRYGIKRTLDALNITVIGINELDNEDKNEGRSTD